jgi:hypothetical protein
MARGIKIFGGRSGPEGQTCDAEEDDHAAVTGRWLNTWLILITRVKIFSSITALIESVTVPSFCTKTLKGLSQSSKDSRRVVLTTHLCSVLSLIGCCSGYEEYCNVAVIFSLRLSEHARGFTSTKQKNGLQRRVS